ncbi:MAG TPA: guanylate kinase [Rhodocyclaceae bacterium]
MKGQLFVVSAPSGAGKTTLTRMLLAADDGIRLSVSHTTRGRRPGEEDGRHYHFIDTATFEAMRERGEFLEFAEVHGNYYGTSKAWISERLAAGEDVLLEIDWQGARQVRASFPDAVSIFVMPPSLAELKRRLDTRATDSTEVIARRIAAAEGEMRQVDDFAYAIINEDLERAFGDLQAIIRAARLAVPLQRARRPEVFLK